MRRWLWLLFLEVAVWSALPSVSGCVGEPHDCAAGVEAGASGESAGGLLARPGRGPRGAAALFGVAFPLLEGCLQLCGLELEDAGLLAADVLLVAELLPLEVYLVCLEPDGLGLLLDERLLACGPLLEQADLERLLAERQDREDGSYDRACTKDHGGDRGDPGRGGERHGGSLGRLGQAGRNCG